MPLMEKLGNEFVITTELGPVKGVEAEASIEKARAYLPLDGINIHDCPMGNLRMNATCMGVLIQNQLNTDAAPHFTCRDRSLLGTQADLLGAHALGIRHFLVTTGDPPKHGPYPSKAVYDYNTVELVRLVKKMNQGLDHNDKEYGGQTDFKVACINVPDAIIEAMEKGSSGIDIVSTLIKEIHSQIDGIHIMALGDVEGTNRIIEFTRSLHKK